MLHLVDTECNCWLWPGWNNDLWRGSCQNYKSGNMMARWTWTHLCRKLSLAVSICRVPPFHLDLFNNVIPAEAKKIHRFQTDDTTRSSGVTSAERTATQNKSSSLNCFTEPKPRCDFVSGYWNLMFEEWYHSTATQWTWRLIIKFADVWLRSLTFLQVAVWNVDVNVAEGFIRNTWRRRTSFRTHTHTHTKYTLWSLRDQKVN